MDMPKFHVPTLVAAAIIVVLLYVLMHVATKRG